MKYLTYIKNLNCKVLEMHTKYNIEYYLYLYYRIFALLVDLNH